MIDPLQIQLSGPYFSSFSAHSYYYELSNELKSVLKLLNFRYGPYCRTASWQQVLAAQDICPLAVGY